MTRRPAATLLAAVATIAFAGNSLLNRAALAGQTIDAPSFTFIRLWSGALLLAVLMQWRRGRDYWPTVGATRRDWIAAAALFAYAACFSFAYLRVGAGTGALLLFAVVQLSLQAYALGTGQRQSRLALAGLVMAMAGLGWLLLPGASAPGATGALLMVVGGVSWAVYTLAGRGGGDAVAMTANAFILSLPMTLLLLPFWLVGVVLLGWVLRPLCYWLDRLDFEKTFTTGYTAVLRKPG